MLKRLPLLISAFAAVFLLVLLAARTSETTENISMTFVHPKPMSVDPRLDEKLEHAEKLWQRSVEDRKTMISASGYNRDFPDGYIHPYHVWDFARPSFFCPHDLERVGTLGDGGKVVCGMTRYEMEYPGPSSKSNPARDFIVYSFGISHDSSFEASLLRRTNAHIWGYDNSVDSWATEIARHQYPRAHFSKVGISKLSDTTHKPPLFSVQDLMAKNNHSYIDLIKMDIEGAEFDALTSMIDFFTVDEDKNSSSTLPFGQLLVEIHFMKEPPGFHIPQDLASWVKWWSSLERMGLRPVSNEDNWIGDAAFGRPRFMEYTLINIMDRKRNVLLWE
ncbi:hypothetical protein S40288_08707 [Stachybotrys chartarum IBT 40288]|nr:hypothetical protein S40288_08707 [Stachybotrys chartarum IBT 40288]